jgi:acyl carrier protein
MLMTEIFDKVKEILSKQLRINVSEIDDDSAIVEDLGADSLDLVEMLMTFEDTYGFSIDDDDAATLRTVRDVVEYIENNAE